MLKFKKFCGGLIVLLDASRCFEEQLQDWSQIPLRNGAVRRYKNFLISVQFHDTHGIGGWCTHKEGTQGIVRFDIRKYDVNIEQFHETEWLDKHSWDLGQLVALSQEDRYDESIVSIEEALDTMTITSKSTVHPNQGSALGYGGV